MIDSLTVLNNTLTSVVQRYIETAAQNTTNGKWIAGWEEVSDLISEQDYLLYFDLIASELRDRIEVMDIDTPDHQLNLSLDLTYCPKYQWVRGDEDIFGCDEKQWLRTFHAIPVSHPLSLTRLAEIGKQAVSYVLERSDTAIEDLTESIGMSMAELKQLGIYDPTPEITKESIIFEVFDVQQVRTYPCTSIQEALGKYKDLGDSPFKFIAANIPAGQPYAGRLMLLHQQDDKDTLLNTLTDTPAMQALHEYFKGTSVEDAFNAVKQYVQSQAPITFTVLGADADELPPASFDSFEDAFSYFEKIPSKEKCISFLVYDQQGRGHGALLLNSDTMHGTQVCNVSESAMEENPHIALAHAKATIALYPNDEKAWKQRDQAEKLLGITDRIISTEQDLLVGKWRIHIVPTGGRHGVHNHLINQDKPLVQFYDTSADSDSFGPAGQLVSSYYADTILGRDGWTPGVYPEGLSLDANVPQWTVSAEEMKQVVHYLNAMLPEKDAPLRSSLLTKIGDAQTRQSYSEAQNHLTENPALEPPIHTER